MTQTKTRTRPAAVILTPSAEARIAALMADAPEGAIGVKLSTPRRGCSGLAYSVDYVTEATLTFAMTHPKTGRRFTPEEIRERTELVLADRFARIVTVEQALNDL